MHPSLAFVINLPFGLANHDNTLVVIFGFVLCLVVIKQISRYQRARLWHDTARLAMEKGQPVPNGEPDKFARGEFPRRRFERHFARYDHWRYLRHGLVMIAIGVALYFALPPDGQAWALIPGLIGVANLLTWTFYLFRADKSRDRDDPANQA